VDPESAFARRTEELPLHPGSLFLIALSGGGDSTALLDVAWRFAVRRKIRIAAARVQHNLRDASAEEAENRLCRRLCAERSVPFTLLEIPAGRLYAEVETTGRGLEQAARNARRRALESHGRSIGASFILYGHTRDDQLETLLMRVCSGSGPEGLRGIPGLRGRSFRPFLGLRRNDLRCYLEDRGIPWVEDRTNDEPTFRRNRIRSELLPLIDDIIPGWSSSLDVLGERAAEVAGTLEWILDNQLSIDTDARGCRWNRDAWNRLPSYGKAMLLWRGANTLDVSGIPDRRIPWSAVKAARDAVDEERLWRFAGMIIESEGPSIRMRPDEEPALGSCGLSRDDLADGFDETVGGFRIMANRRPFSGATAVYVETDSWPLVLAFSADRGLTEVNGRPITDPTSERGVTDVGREILYISIRVVEME